MSTATTQTIADRIEDLDWGALTARMDEGGFVQTRPVLSAGECRELAASFEDGRFRSTIDMRRYRLARASTSTSTRLCPSSSTARGMRSIRRWRGWPTSGRSG